MNTYLLVFWLYQPAGFGETVATNIEVTKIPQLNEQECNSSLKKILDKVSTSKVLVGMGECLPSLSETQ